MKIKHVYLFGIILGVLPAVVSLFVSHSNEWFMRCLLLYLFIYKPVMDTWYVFKTKLYPWKVWWKKYPFWQPEVLRKLYFH